MEKCNKISSKIYKPLCNRKYTTFMWHFLESDLCLTSGILSYIEDINFTLRFYKEKTHTQKQFFNKCYCAKRCALRCAAFWSVVDFVVQFYLRVWEDKFYV